MIRPLCFVALLLIAQLSLAADKPVVMNVWPGDVPGEKGDIGAEEAKADTATPSTTRVGNVSQPTISVFKAPADKNTGAGVLICPGGGYSILAWDKEGTEIAEWLNSIGVNAVVLKYRVPRRKNLPKHEAPLQDAQRAMSIVRSHASEWGIDPARIGVLGFSAGGHLSATLSTNYDKRTYPTVDKTDETSCRPDFTVLVYPAYLIEGDKLAPEFTINDKTPPTFFAHAYDDKIGPENSIAYFLELKKNKVPAELHVYSAGGHGFGMRPSDKPAATWPARCAEWMKMQGLLAKKS